MNQYLARLLGLFKDPRTVIPLAALVATWIGLSFAGTSTSPIIRALSWLTFGRAGLYGGAAGAVGGFLGKAALGTAVLSLCSGSAPTLVRGAISMVRQFKAAFTGKNGPEKIVGIAAGMLIGAGIYIIFAGVKTATWETTMSALAGSAISLIVTGERFAGGLSGLKSKAGILLQQGFAQQAQQTAQPQQGYSQVQAQQTQTAQPQQGFAQQAQQMQPAQPQQGFAQQAQQMQTAQPQQGYSQMHAQQTQPVQPQQDTNSVIPSLLTGAAIGSPICALILAII